uniref:Uncharacterized protein n=1 Tax=Glycine max TaxID=3847 RepID=A0A0R0HBM6_SOYBN
MVILFKYSYLVHFIVEYLLIGFGEKSFNIKLGGYILTRCSNNIYCGNHGLVIGIYIGNKPLVAVNDLVWWVFWAIG